MLRSLLVLALTALVAASAAPAASATREALVFRIVDTPTFDLKPSAECPEGRGEAQLRSLRGEVVGMVENCVLTRDFSCTPLGCLQVESSRQTFFLGGSTIVVHARLVYRFNDDFSLATHTITGTVVGGTGRYAGASGLLVGGGVIRFDPDFTAHPSITEVLLLR